MENLQFEVLDELNNKRSNQIALKLIVTNNTSKKVEVLSITPKVPEGVKVEEEPDTFEEAAIETHRALCTELTEILSNFLTVKSEDYRKKSAEANIKVINLVMKNLPTITLRMYAGLMRSAVVSNIRKKYMSLGETYIYKITSLENAKWAFERWIKETDETTVKEIFEGKMNQLAEKEKQIGGAKSVAIAQIETGSFYSRNYIVKCKRNFLSQNVFNINFDVLYRYKDDSVDLRGTSSKTLVIAPHSFLLSVLAVLFAFLGVALQIALEKNPLEPDYYKLAFSYFSGSAGLKAAIISLLFFNIFEYTDFSERLKIGINWRTALVIGIASGLFGERLIDALKVLLGI